jgi:TolA-binding protein
LASIRDVKTSFAAALLGALTLAGCFYPADRGRALEVRVQKLKEDNDRLSARADEADQKLAATVPRIDAKISEVTRALESLDKAAHRSSADIGVQMQKAVEDVAQLRGEVETYLHKIQELETALKSLSDSTDQRLAALQGEEAKREAEAAKRREELARPSTPKEFYELATQRAQADPTVGRQLFVEFLKKWPKDARAGDAHFALGETYRKEDKCREALYEYGQVIQDFARADAAPRAYLRSAECFLTLKMRDEAKLALQELVKNHPKAPEAKDAKAKLVELERAPKKESPPKKENHK